MSKARVYAGLQLMRGNGRLLGVDPLAQLVDVFLAESRFAAGHLDALQPAPLDPAGQGVRMDAEALRGFSAAQYFRLGWSRCSHESPSDSRPDDTPSWSKCPVCAIQLLCSIYAGCALCIDAPAQTLEPCGRSSESILWLLSETRVTRGSRAMATVACVLGHPP